MKLKRLTKIIKAVLFLITLTSQCFGDTLDNVKDLHDKLFVNSNYDTQIRGIADQTAVLRVGANFSLISLAAVLEKEEAFEVMGLLYLSWTDERLAWNPSDYNGTEELVVVQGTVWKPLVRLANPMFGVKELGSERSLLRIYNTGKVAWMTPDMFQATCKINVVAFPWDRQSCSLNFVVSTYGASEVAIAGESEIVNTMFTDENESWEIVSTKAETVVRVNAQVKYWICFERRSSFNVFVIFIPVVTLSILNAFVFFVKVDSGERISFAITILLSITLYLSLIANSLPSHSNGMSAIIYCLNFVLGESTLICILSIYSLHVYHRTGVPPYHWQFVAMKLLRRKDEKEVRRTEITDDVKVLPGDNPSEFQNNTTDGNVTWQDISLLIDRACFSMAFIAIFASFVLFAYHVVSNRLDCHE